VCGDKKGNKPSKSPPIDSNDGERVPHINIAGPMENGNNQEEARQYAEMSRTIKAELPTKYWA
jgi:hypothetical protein